MSCWCKPVAKNGRGELILFQPEGEEMLFIKRVVGLPGDRVEAAQGQLRINGQQWREGPLSRIAVPDFSAKTVPSGMLFVMGDNPRESADSRAFGPIPEKWVQGKVKAIVYPFSRMQGF